MTLVDKTKPAPGTSAIRRIAFDDPPAASDPASASDSRRVSNKGDDFVMLDFKTPFSIGGRPSSASDLQTSATAATTDLVTRPLFSDTHIDLVTRPHCFWTLLPSW
jgi:hypothetical protein